MERKLPLILMAVLAGILSISAAQVPDSKGGQSLMHEARFNVLAASTRQPIADAVIVDPMGKVIGRTGADGKSILKVPASNSDIYTIRATGYHNMETLLKDASRAAAEYEILLQPDMNGQTKPASPEENNDKVKMYVKQDPATYQKERTDSELNLEFAVQLSASSRPITDKTTLKSWEELGPLFIHNENGMYKVRIGPYNNQEQAKEVLLQAKSRGKKDAFIVIQKGLDGYQPVGYAKQPAMDIENEPAEANNTPVAPKQEHVMTPVTTTTPSLETSESIEYKVRLASYLKPGGFSTKDIDQYGALESYRKGEWTILMIGGFRTEKDAMKVRDEVIAKGFKDAKVVMEKDGIVQLGD